MILASLREEYDSVVIGPKIWGLVLELSGITSRRYPPGVYNYGEPWSEASTENLAQDVVLERLLGEEQLQFLFDQAFDLDSWRRLLTLQIKRTLSRRRQKTVIDRLLSRVRKLGREPPFRLETLGSKVWILRDGSKDEPVELNASSISRLAGSVRHIPQMVADEHASRESMVYRTKDLKTLLELLLGEVGAINESDIARVLELLLTSWLPTFLEDDERLLEQHSEREGPVESLERSETRSMIQTFATSLGEAEQQILLSKSQGVPDAEIAQSLGRSRPWVAQQKQVVLDRVGSEIMSTLDSALHLQAMEDLLVVISDRLAGDGS
ncbi:MAG: hypothetical protein OXF75_09375 [Acidimicrobiaceae bacterium]|nr:hypothetical protein [Acidimicrobiaceae bacterium]